jgi:DNA-binding MarR family transcriptional regulator
MFDTSASTSVAGVTPEQRKAVLGLLIERARLFSEARELSNMALADKFEVSQATIMHALAGKPSRNLDADDIKLIKDAVAERNRIRKELDNYTPPAIADAVGIKLSTAKRLITKMIARQQVPLAVRRRH